MNLKMMMIVPLMLTGAFMIQSSTVYNGNVTTHSLQVRDNAAVLQFRHSPGNTVWPNDGNVPLIAFGWGNQRPLPVEMAMDSSYNPIITAGARPTLTVQRRNDIFSPLLQELLSRGTSIESVNFTVNSIREGAQTYTLYDVRVAAIRNVGGVIAETPSTEEIVLAFSRMTLPGQ